MGKFWSGAGGAVIGGALDLAGGLFGADQSKKLAREQMAFQERMRATQYQVAADDMEKAGLNRILALGSPAGTPSGARAQIGNVAEGVANSARALGRLKAETDLLEAQESKTNQDEKVGKSNEILNADLADESRTRARLADTQTDLVTAQTVKAMEDAAMTRENAWQQRAKNIVYRQKPWLLEAQMMSSPAAVGVAGGLGLLNQLTKGRKAAKAAKDAVQNKIRSSGTIKRAPR